MKVAICISGQLRTWKKCNINVFKLINRLGHKVDFFCHTWDFDSVPRPIIASTGIDTIKLHSQDTIKEVLATYNPISYSIENREKNTEVVDKVIEEGLRLLNQRTLIAWTSPQFYSLMVASNLKSEYELKNNFKYDACIRLRYDQYIPESQIDYIIDILNQIQPNTIYTMHNRECEEYPKVVYGDVFWIADSPTYNKVSAFYKALPTIDSNLFANTVPPEHVLTHYIKSLGIENFRTYLDIKICQFKNDVDEKIRLGLGGTGDHEILYENIND